MAFSTDTTNYLQIVERVLSYFDYTEFRDYLTFDAAIAALGSSIDARHCVLLVPSSWTRTFEYRDESVGSRVDISGDVHSFESVNRVINQLANAPRSEITHAKLLDVCCELNKREGCLAMPLLWPGQSSELSDENMTETKQSGRSGELNCLDKNTGLGILIITGWSKSITIQDLHTMLSIIANSLSLAVIYERLQEDTVKLTGVDRLTGLLNKMKMRELTQLEVERAKFWHEAFAVALCDIDHLKKINDVYSLPGGDIVIQEIARCLVANQRPVDCIGREGGEELVILMPRTSKADALTIIESTRLKISELNISVLDNERVKPTVSFGIASYPADGTTYDELVEAASKACLRAKEAGRNCTKA